jgi:hypothetical protein
MVSLGSCNFRSIYNHANIMDGKIGGGNSEAPGVGNIFHGLDLAVSVDIAISSTNHAVSGLNLLTNGVRIVVSEAVLAKFILSVILRLINMSGALHYRNDSRAGVGSGVDYRGRSSDGGSLSTCVDYGCRRSDGGSSSAGVDYGGWSSDGGSLSACVDYGGRSSNGGGDRSHLYNRGFLDRMSVGVDVLRRHLMVVVPGGVRKISVVHCRVRPHDSAVSVHSVGRAVSVCRDNGGGGWGGCDHGDCGGNLNGCGGNGGFYGNGRVSFVNNVDREVGGGDTEAKGVSDVVSGLDDAVGVDVGVGASDDSIRSLELLLGAGVALVAVVVLA